MSLENEGEPYIKSVPGRLSNSRPDVELLTNRRNIVVLKERNLKRFTFQEFLRFYIPHKRVERPQGCPAGTKVLGGILSCGQYAHVIKRGLHCR